MTRFMRNWRITFPIEFTETEKMEIRNYTLYQVGYATTDKITGIPGEAFNDETFAKLMQEATKYIGFPYQWGGSTPETSFDCSGFVCWVYTHSGVHNLPRMTAQDIYNQCTPVSKEELKPGDLVFFTGTYQSSNPVTHIGIVRPRGAKVRSRLKKGGQKKGTTP